MTFSQQWDQKYKENTHLSQWPWSDLVSFVMRHARPDKKDFKVLELGCGAGANIPFFKKLDVQYFGIEGSPAMVKNLKEFYPDLSDRLIVSDFTQDIPFDETFDLIVDRASLTHNTTEAIKRCLDLVCQKTKPNGKFIGIDWFSTKHSDYQAGVEAEDSYTRTNIEKRTFSGVGRVHFSDKKHLLELFDSFDIKALEHKIHEYMIPEENYQIAMWNLFAVKKTESI